MFHQGPWMTLTLKSPLSFGPKSPMLGSGSRGRETCVLGQQVVGVLAGRGACGVVQADVDGRQEQGRPPGC